MGTAVTRDAGQGRPASRVAWGLCALTLVAATVGHVLGRAVTAADSPAPRAGEQTLINSVPSIVLTEALIAAFAVVGAVVASRRPRNPIGWFLCAIPALLALAALGEGVYWHVAAAREGDAGAAELGLWLANSWWIPTVLLIFVFLPLRFPTGQPPTARWRIVGRLAAVGGTVLYAGTAVRPGPMENFPWADNPLGLEGTPTVVADVGFAVCAGASLAAIASLVVRFRRSHGVERQQLKWVTAATAQLVILWVASAALQPVVSEDVSWAILVAGLLGVAVAVAIAMLRHRLYDIDVVVNRALVYGSLTALLAATYLGSVLLLQLTLSGVTGDSGVAIAASTLAVAAMFGPARGRLQALVDRRFYRRKYDAQRTLEAFSTRLRDEVSLDALTRELRGVVADAMQPAHVSLWMRAPQPERPEAPGSRRSRPLGA